MWAMFSQVLQVHLFLFRGLYILQLLLVAGNWELSRQEAEQNGLRWRQTFQLLTCCFLSPTHSYINHSGLRSTVWLFAHSLPGGGGLVILAIPWTVALWLHALCSLFAWWWWFSHSCNPVDCRLLCPWAFQARILEWVAISFSRGSSQPRNRTQVSCIAGTFFTN